MTVRVVTGYVPIADNPRPPKEYRSLGERLVGGLDVPVSLYTDSVQSCWLSRFILTLPRWPTHSLGDNPRKNSIDYHIVQHQKTAWLSHAARHFDEEVLVWLDYGVLHQPGVTIEVINDFLTRVADEQMIAIPGCWEIQEHIADEYPCWRFCGSTLVVPRAYARPLDSSVREEAGRHIAETGNVSWEVNTWARTEPRCRLPIRWYCADHNATQFTNYRGANAYATV